YLSEAAGHCRELHSFPTRRSSDLIGAAARSKKGDLLFGGTHGITAFYPGEITRSDFRPKMIFSEVRIHNKALSPQEGMLASHIRSEEHTSELQSRENLVCRLLLEK